MTTPPLRLFFALPCPEADASAIARWCEALHLPGKRVATGNFHLTLAFLGMQPRGRLPELERMAGELGGTAFELQLDRLGLWPNGLLHLAPSQPPAALLALARSLGEALRDNGFAVERKAFHPHLTLCRHCPEVSLAATPAFAWEVREFALYVSENRPRGVHYRRLAGWALSAA